MTDTLERPATGFTDGGPADMPPDKVPGGPLADKWDTFIADSKLVNPNNKRKFKIIVVGTGLAGASAAATLAELGYMVESFTFHDSPRRAHSIAAQGGINAAKNYRGDGDSVYRLFYDTVKGGDFRSREGNVYRLAQVSGNIIDQMVAQGVPFAREYGGLLDNRSFGGAQVSRTFYARGQTGQQLLIGAYQQMERQVGMGNIKLWNRMELVDVVVDRRPLRRDRHPRPADRRDRLARRPRRDPVHGRLRQRLLPVDQRDGVQRHGGVAGPPQGRLLRQPVLHADPPDVHPAVRRLAVEAHADVGVAAQRRPGVGAEDRRRRAPRRPDPRGRARLLPRAAVPELRQPGAPRHLVARRQAGRRLRPRRRAAEERRQPRLRRRHRPPRRGRRAGALREPVRDVRADHRREPVPDADAHLPGVALHDGRALGRLRADDHDPRPVLRRRGQLLRPRRQPPRRVGAHAGPRRRLLRAAVHDGQLPRPDAEQADPGHRPRGVQGGRVAGAGALRALPRDRRHPLARLLPPRARQDHLGLLRHGPQRVRAWRRRCRRSPRCTTSSRRTCASPGSAPRSTRRWRRPGGSTTSSSSAC